MQIIIPMSGVGQRFIDAGYKDPKPLIEIDGKPIIEHVVNLFPGETNFKFICNSKHLEETQMRSILERIAPQAEIIEIEPHKFGPIYAVSKIFEKINDDEEVIVQTIEPRRGEEGTWQPRLARSAPVRDRHRARQRARARARARAP